MIELLFTDGTKIKTRCKNPSAAISKALAVSPVIGSIAGTKMARDGVVFGVITGPALGWVAA